MSAGLDLVDRPVASRSPAQARQLDQRFFTGMAIACIIIAFVGFARTYFLGSYFGARPLTTLVHIHGIVSSSWLLLFLTQVSLVGARRTDLHRRLGVAGGIIAALVLVVGFVTAVESARLGHAPPGAPSPLAFLAVPIGTLFAFGLPVAFALYYRRRTDTHKRLMLLGTIAILTPAFARMGRLIGSEGPPYAIGGTCLLILVCMMYDKWAHGRVHPAFLWGGVLVMFSLPFRFAIGTSDAWLSIARWLTN
jgi:hypothetical protein